MASANFLQLTEDKSVKWHAFRGIDLAALESTLKSGLPRSYQHQGEWNLSLSGSPGESFRRGRESTSFLFYTMNPSCLAVAVRTYSVRHEPIGGFQDEYHSTTLIDPSRIVAVTAHAGTLSSPLSDLTSHIEPMRPHRCLDYLQRNLEWTARVCGQDAADWLTQRLQPYRQKTEAGLALDRSETADMQRAVLGTYASYLRDRIDREPSLGDAVNDVMQRSGNSVALLSWDAQALSDLKTRSVQVADAIRVSRAANEYTFPVTIKRETEEFSRVQSLQRQPYRSHSYNLSLGQSSRPPGRK
ncbi:hypothetical protein [Streptomyces sp. NPDC006012]|uniref:hypothetical protein n=1 Tax=Streptomyces sp. NPDC006012 TaxID=3364739 RepID=UPI0036AF4B04